MPITNDEAMKLFLAATKEQDKKEDELISSETCQKYLEVIYSEIEKMARSGKLRCTVVLRDECHVKSLEDFVNLGMSSDEISRFAYLMKRDLNRKGFICHHDSSYTTKRHFFRKDEELHYDYFEIRWTNF